MSKYYLFGAAAFMLFILYDYNQAGSNRKSLKLLFPAGIVILLFSSVKIAVDAVVVYDFGYKMTALFWIVAFAFFAVLIYTLFFAVPFDSAYVQGSKQKLKTNGVYGMCRHPGVLFLAGVYVFVALALGKRDLLVGGAFFTFCNVIYVIIQDRYIFPRVFEGYDEYKRTTHFLLPLGHRHL